MILSPDRKIMTLDSGTIWRNKLKAEGKKLVVTNGCFDLLHRGHADYLFKSRKHGDALMVLINSDISVRQLKGPSRPINCELDRAFLLSSLFFVDSVIIFSEERCTNLFTTIKPDIYVKGADYNLDTINQEEKHALLSVKAEIAFIEFTQGFSSSKIISNM